MELQNADKAIDRLKEAIVSCPKFTVAYINTPWHLLSQQQLKRLPVSDMCADDAAVLMWAGTHTVDAATELLRSWGFNFHSVAAVVDYADRSNIEATTPAADDNDKPKRQGGNRIKSINPPHWWLDESAFELAFARPCGEMLLMGTRGAGPPRNPKFKPAPFQMSRAPDAAKKSSKCRSPAPWGDPTWFCRRPVSFAEDITKLVEDGHETVELFGDQPHGSMWTVGPSVPTWVVPPLNSTHGTIGVAKQALDGVGKVALRGLITKIKKALAKEDAAADAGVAAEAGDTGVETDAVANTAELTVEGYVAKCNEADGSKWDDQHHLRLALWAAQNKLEHHPLRTRKNKRRKPEGADGDKPRHGIAAPGPVTDELCAFFGKEPGTHMARTEVVKLINQYVAANNLKQGKFITMNAPLKTLLNPPNDTEVTFFSLCRLLSPHFIKQNKQQHEGQDQQQQGESGDKKIKV